MMATKQIVTQRLVKIFMVAPAERANKTEMVLKIKFKL